MGGGFNAEVKQILDALGIKSVNSGHNRRQQGLAGDKGQRTCFLFPHQRQVHCQCSDG
ncbi:hypothetical protein [Desulfobacter sp.]|uniref:hypothetical protein n=1 Tax=Desulfobacter sp. TaxID=2294 RepID=UPI003D0ED4F6